MASKFYEEAFEFDLPRGVRKPWYESLSDAVCFVLLLLFVGLGSYLGGRVHSQFEAVNAGAARWVNDPVKKEIRFEFIRCQ